MGVRGVGGGKSLWGWGTWLYGLAAVGGSAVVAGSRVYLGYHSLGQVAVGYGVGVVVAVAWWAVGDWEAGREMLVDLLGWFWVRDSARGKDLVEYGYWAAKEGWKIGKGE